MKRLFKRVKRSPSAASLRAWFSSTPGRELFALEQAALDAMLEECFGHYLLQLGSLGVTLEPLSTHRIKYRILQVSQQEDVQGDSGVMVAEATQLPVASDSIDVVLLSHTLDFARDPHQLLREVERVLIPEGHVIIVGFNPWSLWGLWQLFRLRSNRVPWCGHFLSAWRVHDWLSLLGFQHKTERTLMFRPPLQRPGVMQRLDFLERIGGRFWSPLAAVYMILAVKRVSRLTPIKPAWKLRPRSIRGQVVEPTVNRFRKMGGRE